MKETAWMRSLGVCGWSQKIKCIDTLGVDIKVIPDLMLISSNGGYVFVEYKDGLKLNTDGKLKGKAAAERAKSAYKANTWSNTAKAVRERMANTLGWNHSIYKMTSMFDYYTEKMGAHGVDCEVVIVDPKMNKHFEDAEYSKKMSKAVSGRDIKFMSTSEFESAYAGCLEYDCNDWVVPDYLPCSDANLGVSKVCIHGWQGTVSDWLETYV